jgi:hypothetical protein
MGPWLVDLRTRDEFDTWLGGNPPTPYRPVFMVVRGDSEAIREFIPNALDAAKLSEHRVVAWLKDPALLTDDEASELFGGNQEALAVVLSEDHQVASFVYGDRLEVVDATFAFEMAEGR